jgi:hypothetical protein
LQPQTVGCMAAVTDNPESVVSQREKRPRVSHREGSAGGEQEMRMAVKEKIAGHMRFESGLPSGSP